MGLTLTKDHALVMALSARVDDLETEMATLAALILRESPLEPETTGRLRQHSILAKRRVALLSAAAALDEAGLG